MKLFFYKGTEPNFGDELNEFVWNKVLPQGFLDNDGRELFLGIGSIIYDHHPQHAIKHIVGSGFGGYSGVPNVHDGTWNPVFLRGPRTAHILGLPPDLAIGDSAILLRLINLPAVPRGDNVAFMPHFESLERGRWEQACHLAGIRFLDPRRDAQELLTEIAGARLLVTEAMHGAIVADALRTPWIAARPIQPKNRMKWLDWADSLSIDLRTYPLVPTTVLEMYIQTLQNNKRHGPKAYRLNEQLAPINRALTNMAARRLTQMAKLEPQLSKEREIKRATERAHEALSRFVASRQ